MSTPYQTYGDFKASWDQSNRLLDSLISQLAEKPSLAKTGVIDVKQFANFYDPSFYRQLQQYLNAAVSATGNKKRDDAGLAAVQRLIDGLKSLNNLPDGTLSSSTQSKLNTIIANAQKYITGEWVHIGGLIAPTITLIGALAEDTIRKGFEDKATEQGICDFAVAGTIDQLTSLNLRGSWSYDTPKHWRVEHKAFQPLTDIQVVLSDTNSYVNISVKESLQSSSTKTLKALTTNFGAMTRVVFEEAPDDYYGYTFYRVAGRLGGGTGPVREIKQYLAQKNLAEALIGSGRDEINDFIINGKVISAESFVKALKEEAQASTQIVKLEAALPVQRLKDTSADAAVKRYITQKRFNEVAGAKAVLNVTIPRNFGI